MGGDKEKAAASTRMLTGLSTPAKESLRLKCHVRSVERWVAEKKLEASAKAKEAAPAPAPSPSPAGPTPGAPLGTVTPRDVAVPDPTAENKELKAVLDAAKGRTGAVVTSTAAPPSQTAPPTKEAAAADARKKDAAEALKYYATLKD